MGNLTEFAFKNVLETLTILQPRTLLSSFEGLIINASNPTLPRCNTLPSPREHSRVKAIRFESLPATATTKAKDVDCKLPPMAACRNTGKRRSTKNTFVMKLSKNALNVGMPMPSKESHPQNDIKLVVLRTATSPWKIQRYCTSWT